MNPLSRRGSNPVLHLRRGKQSLSSLRPLPMPSWAPLVPPVQTVGNQNGHLLPLQRLLHEAPPCSQQKLAVSYWLLRGVRRPVVPGRRIQSSGQVAALNVPCSVWQVELTQQRCRQVNSQSLYVMERTEIARGSSQLQT